MNEPMYKLREKVTKKVEAIAQGGVKISQDVDFYVGGIVIESTSTGQEYSYYLFTSLPSAYYLGGGFCTAKESEIW